EPVLRHLHGARRRPVRDRETLVPRHRDVVITRDDRRLSLDEQCENIRWIGPVTDGVAADPDGVDRTDRRKHRLERDEVRVDVAEDGDLHARVRPHVSAACWASATENRPSRKARPITTDATP